MNFLLRFSINKYVINIKVISSIKSWVKGLATLFKTNYYLQWEMDRRDVHFDGK